MDLLEIGSRRIDVLLYGDARIPDCLKAECGRHGNAGCTAADTAYIPPKVRLNFVNSRNSIIFAVSYLK